MSALTETAVRETLAALRGRAIVVVIAHRLSTVNLCDRVAVMRAGRVVALGDGAHVQSRLAAHPRGNHLPAPTAATALPNAEPKGRYV